METEVNIFRFKMSLNRVIPSDNQIEAITKFKLPSSIRDMRVFMGLVNQSIFYHIMAKVQTMLQMPYQELKIGQNGH